MALASPSTRPLLALASTSLPTGGTYVNTVALRRGVPAWTPDGRTILIAERGSDEPGYNGDPDRAIDRVATESFNASAQQMVLGDRAGRA